MSAIIADPGPMLNGFVSSATARVEGREDLTTKNVTAVGHPSPSDHGFAFINVV
jgi:hypothetical protein